MDVPGLRLLVTGISPWRLRFEPGSVHVGFVVDKRKWVRFFTKFFSLPLSISFHCGSPCSHIIWGINNRPVGAHSSEK
jgi:hypothetical protein